MYNVLLSKVDEGLNDEKIQSRLKKIINSNMKLLIFPWSFPVELDEKQLDDFFEKRRLKFIAPFVRLGIKEEKIYVANCYRDTKKDLIKKIKQSDILFFTGGNPEMLFSKVVHKMELLYEIKHYEGIIIGESAGALMQFERYFITKKNNFYPYFAFYDGFGNLSNPFYIDVHSVNKKLYMDKLKEVAHNYNKNIYAIYNNGAIIYNRKNGELELFGKVDKI